MSTVIESPIFPSSEPTPNPDGLTEVQRQVAESNSNPTSTQSTAPELTDWKTLYQAEREKNERMEVAFKAGRFEPATPRPDVRPAMTNDRLRALWGDLRYQKSSEAERITALGGDPSTVDRGLLKRLFGSPADGNDGREAQELAKTNMGRYRTLREYAKAIRIL